VGKLTKVKGFERLAKIHKRLLDEGINNRLYILGIGEEKENLKKYIEDNSLENTLILLGYKTNPYKYVKKCDLYVCSSYSEGFSTSVTESLIVGTPVVTTLCSGMTELLGENNEYGIVTENDEEALYQGVKGILTNSGDLIKYANSALKRSENFSTKKTTGAVENMLNNL
jgi:glycosyltransferase involved in cell wall biosynthesis